MALSGPRPLALLLVAAVGGAAGTGAAGIAEARPKAKPHARETRVRAKRKATRVRAVKVDAGAEWVPADALGAELAPLTGAAAIANGGGGASGTGAQAAVTPATSGPAATTPSTTTPPIVQAVGVTLDDRGGYSARVSRPAVTAGSVVVQLINQGEDEHNLRVVPTDHDDATVDFPLTASGANATKTLTLKPGSYRVFCTLTTPVNHETAGMNATLKVT